MFEAALDGVAGVAGGDIPTDVFKRFAFEFAGDVEADGNRGQAEERGLDRGADGTGVDDVDADVAAHIHAGDDEVGPRVIGVVFGPYVFDGELDAVGGSAVDREAGHAVVDAHVAGHQRDVEGHAVAGGGLHFERGDGEDLAEVEQLGVKGFDARGAKAVVIGEEDAHER